MCAFPYPWLLKEQQNKAISAKSRWIDRVFGFEYTKFEREQIKAFSDARRDALVEIYGFVSWIDRTKFLLLPTRTTNSTYIICQAIDGLVFPPNNQYVSCKGKWGHDIHLGSFYRKLIVEDIHLDTPDYKRFTSDIKASDFQGQLFENWANIDPTQQNLLAQYFISSPSLPSRVGGITVSMFNPRRQNRLVGILNSDLRRSIAPELLGTKKMTFDVPELNKTHRLFEFGWNEKISDYEKISENTQKLLNRDTNVINFEQSISLLSTKHQPNNFDSIGLVKSDYPIVIEEHVEKRRNSTHTDLGMSQFIVASHMNTPSIEQKTYDAALNYTRKEISEFVDTKTQLSTELLGHDKMLDLNFNGKPTSILNLAISQQRISNTDTVDMDKIKSTTKDYIKNLNIVFRVWDDRTAGGKINPLATLNYDEEKVLVFLHRHGPHTFEEICKATKLGHEKGRKTINYLYNIVNAIYLYSEDRYGAVPT